MISFGLIVLKDGIALQVECRHHFFFNGFHLLVARLLQLGMLTRYPYWHFAGSQQWLRNRFRVLLNFIFALCLNSLGAGCFIRWLFYYLPQIGLIILCSSDHITECARIVQLLLDTASSLLHFGQILVHDLIEDNQTLFIELQVFVVRKLVLVALILTLSIICAVTCDSLIIMHDLAIKTVIIGDTNAVHWHCSHYILTPHIQIILMLTETCCPHDIVLHDPCFHQRSAIRLEFPIA